MKMEHHVSCVILNVIRRRVAVASAMCTRRTGAGSVEGQSKRCVDRGSNRSARAEAQIEGQSRECRGSEA